MNRLSPWFLSAFLGVGVFLPAVVLAQAPAAEPDSPTTQQSDQKQDQKQEKNNKKKAASSRQLFKELDTPYKKWLDEDVVYIITDEERKAFLQLDTNEEREQFVETFWQRRNPDPDPTDNPLAKSITAASPTPMSITRPAPPVGRPIAAAFTSCMAPRTASATHSYGETWDRPPADGGGETQTYAYEDWTYHYIEGNPPV